jgi:KDO2-lipid IV(A) lauroyltransferase
MSAALANSETAPLQPRRESPLVRVGLGVFFFLAQHAVWLLRIIRPLAVRLALLASPTVAKNLRSNAGLIFKRALSRRTTRKFARSVMGNFYSFVVDLAASGHASVAAINNRVERVDGEAEYLAARQRRRGAVLVTMHMGAFEVGLAALRRVEPKVTVVFKRDAFARFERIRQRVRQQLGVREAAIDDGLSALFQLRNALLDDEVVVMQGDRAMPGQRSQTVPFLGGHLRMPTGPVRLARLTGSPVVPVFVLQGRRGTFRIQLATPIDVGACELGSGTTSCEVDPALLSLARTFESIIAEYPEQWLVLERAFAAAEPRQTAGEHSPKPNVVQPQRDEEHVSAAAGV